MLITYMSLVHSTVVTAWSVAYTQNYKVLLFQCLYSSLPGLQYFDLI